MKMRVGMSEREIQRTIDREHIVGISMRRHEERESKSKRAREQESERARERESERAREPEIERARERDSARVGEQESERASERASKRARERESKRGRERERTCHPPCEGTWEREGEKEPIVGRLDTIPQRMRE